jgi:hypothetical protein
LLAVAAVIALLFIWAVPGFAQQPRTGADVYRVTMKNPGTMGVRSDCSADEGYVLAWNNNGDLQSGGSLLDTDGVRVPLFLDLVTDVRWTRKYDVGRGLSGVFNGCFGETLGYPPPGNRGASGLLFIVFEKKKVSTVSFRWNFDAYESQPNKIRDNIQEQFMMTSDPITLAVAWTGQDSWTAHVAGTFELKRYLNAGGKGVMQSLTNGQGRYFEFDLVIEKLLR